MSENSHKAPLSVTIIASNEALNIQRCLESIKGLASEIVIVLNNCNDDTETISKRYTNKIISHPWTCHRDQKNIAISHATQPWILSLDADEEVSPELKQEIFNFVKMDNPNFDGAYFSRRNFFLGRWIKHGDWSPEYILRLARRSQANFQGDEIHDRMKVDGRTKKVKGFLYHYSNPSISDQILKINVFADAFFRQKVARNKKWFLIESLFRPCWRFFRAYFLRLGFLDGFPGFYIAIVSSFACFVRYTRLYEGKLESRKPIHSES